MTELGSYREKPEDRVRARILLPFALIILSVGSAFLMAAYMYEGHVHQKSLTESVAAVERLFLQGLENDASMMQAALRTFWYVCTTN